MRSIPAKEVIKRTSNHTKLGQTASSLALNKLSNQATHQRLSHAAQNYQLIHTCPPSFGCHTASSPANQHYSCTHSLRPKPTCIRMLGKCLIENCRGRGSNPLPGFVPTSVPRHAEKHYEKRHQETRRPWTSVISHTMKHLYAKPQPMLPSPNHWVQQTKRM